MRIDVLLGEALTAPADVADQVVIVVDVLRAATTVAQALSNGAVEVRPFSSVAETRAVAQQLVGALTAGERQMVRIDGFDLGNSPLEYSRAIVEGRTILFTTTNGTAALLTTRMARRSFFAALVNGTATIDAAERAVQEECALSGVTIVCAGQDRTLAFEDVVCAGRLARLLATRVPSARLTDAAQVACNVEHVYVHDIAPLAGDATHARSLASAGFADDVACCIALDTLPVAVTYRDGVLRPTRSPAMRPAHAAVGEA